MTPAALPRPPRPKPAAAALPPCRPPPVCCPCVPLRRTQTCRFSGLRIYPGKGVLYIRVDGQVRW